MCNICQRPMPHLDIQLTDADKTIVLCPNHMMMQLSEGQLNFRPNNDFTCQVTGKRGAVKFSAEDEEYVLAPPIMLRLINHSLKPEEYRMLATNGIKFEIHHDFYDETGYAHQPMMSNEELTTLYQDVFEGKETQEPEINE